MWIPASRLWKGKPARESKVRRTVLALPATRYGGMKGYQRLLPVFLGLSVGDMVHEGIWGFVAWGVRRSL